MTPSRPREDVSADTSGSRAGAPAAAGWTARGRVRRRVRIAGGQDSVKGVIFRLGHMGTVSTEELMGGIGAVERALMANGATVKKGAWAEAFAQHAP